MATETIGGIGTSVQTSAVAPRAGATRGFTDLKSEDFFKLLIAQLQSQDPLKPTDNQALLEQMSLIRQMEQSTSLNRTLGALAGEQRFASTAGLIGHYVGGRVTDSGGNSITVEGVVTGVIYEANGSATLQLHNGRILPAEKVQQVTLLENLPPDVLERIETEMSGGGPGAPSAPGAPAALMPLDPDGDPSSQPANDAARTRGAPTGREAQPFDEKEAADRQAWLGRLLRAARARQ